MVRLEVRGEGVMGPGETPNERYGDGVWGPAIYGHLKMHFCRTGLSDDLASQFSTQELGELAIIAIMAHVGADNVLEFRVVQL